MSAVTIDRATIESVVTELGRLGDMAQAVARRQPVKEVFQARDRAWHLMRELRSALTQPEQPAAARSLTDELMDCVDRLGGEADTVDPRVWEHLLVYAPKPAAEPVAWVQSNHLNLVQNRGPFLCRLSGKQEHPGFVPLYTAAPQRQPLTDEQIAAIYETAELAGSEFPSGTAKAIAIARAIERAHGITGETE